MLYDNDGYKIFSKRKLQLELNHMFMNIRDFIWNISELYFGLQKLSP